MRPSLDYLERLRGGEITLVDGAPLYGRGSERGAPSIRVISTRDGAPLYDVKRVCDGVLKYTLS